MPTDFPNGVNAPQAPSYASPLIDFGIVGDMPKSIFEGQQRARTTQQQTMFRNGIPKTVDGQNDYQAMADKLIQFGDLDSASKLPALQKQQLDIRELQSNPQSPYYRGDQPTAGAPASAAPQAARNSQTTTATPVPPQGARDERPARPDNSGGFTTPGQQPAQPAEQPAAVMPYNEPPGARKLLNTYDPPDSNDLAMRQRNLERLAASSFPDMAKMANGRLEFLRKQAEYTPEQKNNMAGAGGSPSAAQVQANVDLDKAARTPTDLQKNTQGAGPGGQSALQTETNLKQRSALDTKAGEGNITSWGKQYEGVQKLAQNSYDAIHKADLAKSLTMQPGYYSGPFNKSVEMTQQFRSTFGTNPNAALPAEAFQKVVADMTQGAIRDLAAAGVGRIMLAEVQTINKSMGSLGISPAGNRAQLELFKRVSLQSQEIAQIAQNIAMDNRIAPETKKAALDQAVMKFHQTHPLVSQEEIDNPGLLAAPDVPASIKTNDELVNWARSVGIPVGGAIKIDGRMTGVPRITVNPLPQSQRQPIR